MTTSPHLPAVRYEAPGETWRRSHADPVAAELLSLTQALETARAGGRLPDQIAGLAEPLPPSFVADVTDWRTRVERLLALDTDRAEGARAIVTVRRDALELAPLLRLAGWLRFAGLPVPAGAELGSDFDRLDFPAQARALARFLMTSDGHVPFDFDAAARGMHPELRPALVYWFIGTYLASPRTNSDPRVSRNRSAAIDGFLRFFEHRAQPMPGLTPLPPVPEGFPQVDAVVVDRILGPTLDRVIDVVGPTTWPITLAARAEVGVVVETRVRSSCDPATEEALAPALAHVRTLAICPGGRTSAGPFHNRSSISASVGDAMMTAQFAERIIGERLELLVHVLPFGGAAGSLAGRRLARTTVVVGGTSPSGQADYVVVGEAFANEVAGRPRRVIVPGLGVWFRPQLPSRERDRKPGDRRVLAVSVAPASALDAHSVAAWDAALGGRARLHLVPGVTVSGAEVVGRELGRSLSHTDVTLSPSATPSACADLLVDADLYLHVPGDLGALTALAAGCPVVARAGSDILVPAVMKAIGMPDWLVARTPSDYCNAVRRLVTDPVLRVEVRASIDRARVLAVLADPDLTAHLAAAINWIRSAGPSTGGHPVRVAAGMAPSFA